MARFGVLVFALAMVFSSADGWAMRLLLAIGRTTRLTSILFILVLYDLVFGEIAATAQDARQYAIQSCNNGIGQYRIACRPLREGAPYSQDFNCNRSRELFLAVCYNKKIVDKWCEISQIRANVECNIADSIKRWVRRVPASIRCNRANKTMRHNCSPLPYR